MTDPTTDRDVIAALAQDLLVERRRARRWGIFFKVLFAGIALAFVASVLAAFGARERICLDKCTALVEVRGELDTTGRASAERVIAGLQAAFKNSGTKGVLLRINSPGGSPVQAGQIYDEVRRLRAKYPDIPLHAVVEEMAASGGYYVAAAADRIYVDRASVVGSIGVIYHGFGVADALDKVGVESRTVTAGTNKAFMDPFAPVDPQQKAYLQSMLDEVHLQFIGAVREGRGTRLKETPEMFSGLVWHGAKAIELGLADALGNVDGVARDVFGAEEIVDFTPQEALSERFARKLGAVLAGEVAAGLRTPGLR
jgi:protease IV